MCGIGGIIALTNEAPSRVEAQRLSDAMEARGPDGSGLYADESGGAIFVHRRLAIIDTTEASAQPMVSTSGRYVIVFNGECRDLSATFARATGLVSGPLPIFDDLGVFG
jgi:asparagine synthase (glutamine-hydrolysing)